jgi:hypothetical protein
MICYETAEGANVIIRGSMVLEDGWRATAAGPGRGGGAGQRQNQGPNQARTWDVDLDGSWLGGPYARGVSLRFIRPGKPIEKAYVESLNGKFRDECPNEHWFISLADAKAAIEAWRVDYNTVRPHSSLDGATPHHFARISVGARRLSPARPDEEDDERKPGNLTLSRSGFWRRVSASSRPYHSELVAAVAAGALGDKVSDALVSHDKKSDKQSRSPPPRTTLEWGPGYRSPHFRRKGSPYALSCPRHRL